MTPMTGGYSKGYMYIVYLHTDPNHLCRKELHGDKAGQVNLLNG